MNKKKIVYRSITDLLRLAKETYKLSIYVYHDIKRSNKYPGLCNLFDTMKSNEIISYSEHEALLNILSKFKPFIKVGFGYYWVPYQAEGRLKWFDNTIDELTAANGAK